MDVAALVARFLEHIDTYYVLQERCPSIRERIEGRLAAGAYANLDPQALADLITTEIRECAGDLHFKVVYREAPQSIRQRATEESEEEVAEFRRLARFNNYGCSEVRRLAGNVGYWKIEEFYDLIDGSGPTFRASMHVLSASDALIVDLRGNSGGDVEAVSLACSFFFEIEPVHLITVESMRDGSTRQHWTLPHVECARYLAKDVYVLIDARTFSAAEEFAFALQDLKRATLVGENTAGAAHLREQFQLDEHFLINIPTQRPVSPRTGANWEGTGVSPDVRTDAEAAFDVAYGLALRSLASREGVVPEQREEIRKTLETLSDGG